MSMRAKTIILIILIIFITTVANFISSLYFTNASLEKTIEQDLDFAIGIADRLVGTKMDLMKTEAANIAAQLLGADSGGSLNGQMAEQMKKYSDISALSVFDRNGVIASYSEPAHDHDVNLHAEHLEMVYTEGVTIISSPFYCSTSHEYVMNVYTPMGADRILAVTMPGQIFSDMLSEQRLWQTGNIFMLNEVGMFIGATNQESVQAMNDYVLGNKKNPDGADEEISALVQKILSSDKGVERYSFEGVENLCAHSRINNSALGWCVAVTVPINASPQADAQQGQLYAAVVFLIFGVAAAFFLSRVTSRPFKEIERQNHGLAQLNETIQAQADAIREEHERVRLMMDATPLACRLWNRNFQLIESNEAAVRLFGLRNRQEYMERYFELSPEYQPDGQPTKDKIQEIVSETFEKGEGTYDWLYCLSDGTLIPCEVRMVRIPYGGDYVVAAYSRDLREQQKMLAEIEYRDRLLDTSRRVASILFNTAEDKEIGAVLVESMELLGRCVDVDQSYITQNETVDDIQYFVCKSAWVSEPGKVSTAISPGMQFPWGLDPDWDRLFRRGECMNGQVKDFPVSIQEFFAPFETRSVLVIPVFVQEQFWGIVGFSDCRKERSFDSDEVDILRSMSLMMATAVSRSEQSARIYEAHHRIRLLTNATPLGFNLWDRSFRNIETNDTAVRLFGLKSQQEYLSRFSELSPIRQPDGRLSKEVLAGYINTAFDEGYLQAEWLHQKPDGTPIPVEITFVRLAYGDEHMVAGYIRDLREYKKMLSEIERRDELRAIVNEAVDILLRADPDEFSHALQYCMGMMAGAIRADRMYLFKNYMTDGRLYCYQLCEWSESDRQLGDSELIAGICYDETMPKVKEMLSRGEYVHSLVGELSSAGRKWFSKQGIKAILFVPVFSEGEFWGFVGFDNCHSVQLFTENEESVMRSGGLLIAAAFLRNEHILSIRDTSARLEVALAAAKDANNAKSNFLAHMSHEIRTPLNAVIGLSELTLGEKSLCQEAEANLEKINSAGTTILSIVNDILDISKIESGRLELNPVRYDTPSLINDAVSMNIVRLGEKEIRFSLDVDENLPGRLYGDDLRVKQIFNNLLSNAFKYTYSGSIDWRITFEREGDDIWLISSIKDTGIGIRPEDIHKLFSAYEQVDRSTNRKVEGTGLGLTITRRLVEMMGGTITVESQYGEGSIFHIRLRQKAVSDVPIGKEAAGNLMEMRYSLARREKNTQLARVNLSYACVLVVDDIATNLDVMKGMLRPYQVKVDCAASGPQAIRMIRAENPRYSAVFMDHMMPEMDGIEATRVIRAEIGTDYARQLPIIALTANTIVGNEDMFLSHGFQAFVSKPVDIMKLDIVLRQWVRDKELEGKLWDTDKAEALSKGEGCGSEGQKPSGSRIEIAGMSVSRALERFGGDEMTLFSILRSYAANTPLLLEHLGVYLEAEQLADYAVVVHGIKGSSYGIFAQEAGKEAERLEILSKDGDLDEVKNRHPAFEKCTRRLIGEIQKKLDIIEEKNEKPVLEAPDPELLGELREACEMFNMDRVDQVMEQLESYRYERGDKLIAWLRSQVNNMVFEEIARGEFLFEKEGVLYDREKETDHHAGRR